MQNPQVHKLLNDKRVQDPLRFIHSQAVIIAPRS